MCVSVGGADQNKHNKNGQTLNTKRKILAALVIESVFKVIQNMNLNEYVNYLFTVKLFY